MATAGEGRAPYESSGAGGKFRKKPFRRSAPATPYDRPPTALRNKNPGLLTKLVDPASRLIYAGAHKLFNVFRNRLPPLSLQGPPEINEEPQNVSQEAGQNNSIGVSKSIDQDGNSAATGISDLEQMLKQKTFTRSEIQHLTSLLHSRTTELPLSDNIEINGANPNPLLRLEASTSGSMKKHSAFSTPFVSSKVVEEETPSPAELAKSYMGTITRPTKLINNTTTSLQKTPPITSITPKKTANDFKNLENGFMTTPRTRGRSAMYSMARTPYSKSPNQKGLMMSDYNSQGSSLKRRSSVLDDDFGTGGPLRRTRQKPNLLLDKRELGYTTFQQQLLLRNEPEENSDISMDGSRSKSKSKSTHVSVPEKSTQTAAKIFQHLESLTPKSPTKLTSNMLHGQALKSLEKMDSPKFVPVSHDNGESTQKSKVQKFDNGGGSTSTSKGKEKVEEDGPRKFPVPFNMLTAGNGDVAVSVKESEEIVAIDEDDLVSKLPPEPPQNKRAFQMSIDDDDYDDDNDDDIIHVNGHVSFPPVENNKPETSLVPNKPVSADISEPATPPEVFKTPAPVEATPVVVPEVAKVVEPEKAKPPPETGFKFSSTFTTQKDEVTPAEKVSPFQFSEYKPKESSDPKPVESTSIFSTETKNDVTNENGNDKKVENIPAATSASGMFSFASSAKTPDSTPSVFSSLTPIPASGGNSNTSSLLNNTSNSNVTPVSLPTPVFSFGSGKPTTSMPETSNNKDAVVEKEEPKSTISSPFFAATSTTTTTPTTNGGGLFGFGSQAATSTTTTNGGSLFGFSAPAATTTTSTATNGGGLFGFSSPAATSTATSTGNGGAPFGFSSSAATSTTTAATTTNAGAIFGFSAPATTSTTTAAASSGGALFGFTAPATTSTTTSFFNTTSTSSTPVTQSAPFLFGSGSTTSPFGSSAPASSNSTTGPTTTLFGSSWQQPQNNSPVFSFGASSSATQSSPVFSFNTSGPTKPSFTPVFGSQTPTFQNNDQMSMEDTMAEDSMQTPTPVASSPFGQPAPGFMFGVPNPAPPVAAAPFQFGGPAANQQPPPQNPFQSSSLEFNGGGGSFSLGSGGDKSGRRIVRVNKSKNRRK